MKSLPKRCPISPRSAVVARQHGGQSIRLRSAEALPRSLLALDEFQHFVDVRQASIPNDVMDWLKEQVEEARLAIVFCLQRCLRSTKMNSCDAASARR